MSGRIFSLGLGLAGIAVMALCTALALPTAKLETVTWPSPARVRERAAAAGEIRIPAAWRVRNWVGPWGQGSCVHASIVHLLHWQGQHELAAWWRAHHADGSSASDLAPKLEAAGLRWAETRQGDVAFLNWAMRTRRGAAVVVNGGAHMVNLIGLDAQSAKILDSNAPGQTFVRPRAEFLQDWTQSGGWAVTIVGTPKAPLPWIVKRTVR